MRLDKNVDVEVAIAAAIRAGFAVAGDAQARAVVDAFRDRDLHLVVRALLARAVAVVARILDDLARAVAALARRFVHHLAEWRVAHRAAHARALAVWAYFRRGACRCARAVTRRAVFHARNGEFFLFAERCLLEREVEVVADVRAALRDWAAAARAAPAKEHVKNITKAIGRKAATARTEVKIEAAAERIAARRAARAAKAEAVILCALLRVFEDVVGRIDLLHLLFRCLRIVMVEVRMIFARQFPIGLLDVGVGRILADAEDLVQIALFAHVLSPCLAIQRLPPLGELAPDRATDKQTLSALALSGRLYTVEGSDV